MLSELYDDNLLFIFVRFEILFYVNVYVEKMIMALMMYDVELVQEANNLFICGFVNSHNRLFDEIFMENCNNFLTAKSR